MHDIAGLSSLDQLRDCSRPVSGIEQLAQLGDVVADLRARGGRDALVVEVTCELLERDHAVGLEQEHRQHTPLFRAAEPNRLAVREHLE